MKMADDDSEMIEIIDLTKIADYIAASVELIEYLDTRSGQKSVCNGLVGKVILVRLATKNEYGKDAQDFKITLTDFVPFSLWEDNVNRFKRQIVLNDFLNKIPVEMPEYDEKFGNLLPGHRLILYSTLKIHEENRTPSSQIDNEKDVRIFCYKYEQKIPNTLRTPTKKRPSPEQTNVDLKKKEND
ncbi:hypothetical protein QAD02_017606 [Eretmocerus hayati]|uniref:Uncharacterized protein n=1 Tax=Eretmocerus hayati TaxID=131215 RepID=A0ACC2PGV2_9HYME|nr:hypothetical protein QAD02_017606 [Eretmocerus hayati]